MAIDWYSSVSLAGARGVLVGADRIDVWAKGHDARTWHRWWEGTEWAPWERLPR